MFRITVISFIMFEYSMI